MATIREAEISELLKKTRPIKIEYNKNDKVDKSLLVRNWDIESLISVTDQSELLTLSEDVKTAVRVAILLSEFDYHLIERAVSRVGRSIVESTLNEVYDLIKRANESLDVLADNRDNLFAADGRRRTPGGVFWRVLKNEKISKDDAKFIFKDNTKRQQGIRRQLVRDRWTENHLTVLRNKPSKHPKHSDKESQSLANKIDVIKKIASKLSMSEVSIIERLVVRKSVEYALSVFDETLKILESGQLATTEESSSLLVVAGGRRRTPGGVFSQIVKNKTDIADIDKRFIFARASGGKAPSMSDLMTMSLALRDRPQALRPSAVSSVVLQAASDDKENVRPNEWEFQRRVGNTWEPGFVGADSFGDQMPSIVYNNPSSSLDDRESIITQIAKGLKLYTETRFIEKVVELFGGNLGTVVELYNEARDMEMKGGVTISETNTRKRTPKSVFVYVLRRRVGNDEKIDTLLNITNINTDYMSSATTLNIRAPEIITDVSRLTRLADSIIVELEKMRVPSSDIEIVRNIVSVKGEVFVRNLFERVRRRFNKGKWMDTPGQLFGKMLRSGLSNDELNRVFESSRSTQLFKNDRISSLSSNSSQVVILSPSEEKCSKEITIGLALIGITAADVSIIERIVTKLGESTAIRMLNRTRVIEAEGGQRTRDGKRRKTPNGVYLSLLATEEKVSKDDMKYIFEKPSSTAAGVSAADERKKEDSHFAPSLFTPVNPFRVIDNSGKDTEFVEAIKKEIRPVLSSLEFISVLDPRLETVIRGVVLLGPSAINLIDKCVYYFGEKRTEGWLEISHAQVAEKQEPVENLPSIYKDLVKAAGGIPQVMAPTLGC